MRKLSAVRHALLVAMTGRRGADAWRTAKEAGFDRLLLKPVGLEALEEALVLCST
jgi:CheY-like chemotaxis protein